MRNITLCPDCGKNESRGSLSPVYVHYEDPTLPAHERVPIRYDEIPKEGIDFEKQRHVNRQDETCPKCGGASVVPLATTEPTALALRVRVAASGYFEREQAAIARRRGIQNVIPFVKAQ